MIILLMYCDMQELEDDNLKDSAKHHPWKRHIIRNFTTNFSTLLILIIPALVFYIVTVFAGLSTTIGISLAFLFFFNDCAFII